VDLKMVKKTNILLVSLLILMAFMAFSVSAVTTYINITDSSYADKSRSSPLTSDDCIKLNLSVDGQSNTVVEQVNVTLTSTTNSTGILVTLNETDVASDFFNILVNGSFPFNAMQCINVSTVVSSMPADGTDYTNYSIKVTNNPHKQEVITATYSTVSDTVIMQQTGVLYWLSGGTGTLNTGSTYISDTAATSVFGIGYNDSGIDTDPLTTQQVIINVNTSSFFNISICLNESTVNSPVYTQVACAGEDATNYLFNLNTTGINDNTNELQVVSGDNINMSYLDTDFDGNSVIASDLIWVDSLGYLVAGATTELDPDNSTGIGDIFTVYDNGTNLDYSAIDNNAAYLTITSYDVNWNSLGSMIVGMNETAANTGTFALNGTTLFANTSSSLSTSYWSGTNLQIMSRDGGFINITYNDQSNFSGDTPDADLTPQLGPISLDVHDVGVLSFNWSGQAFGTGDSILIKVNDSDLNTDASAIEFASITVESTTSIGLGQEGITVQLNESNEAGTATSADSSVFSIPNATGGLIFGDASVYSSLFSNDNFTLNVSAGDVIYINYTDATGTTVTSSITAWMDQNGGMNITDAPGAVSTTFTISSSMFFNLTDAGKNTDNVTSQCVTVTVNSTSDPTGFNMGLNETNVDSGEFRDALVSCSSTTFANLTFSLLASDGDTNTLYVDEGDTIQIMYNDNKGFDGSDPAVVFETVDLQETGSITLNKNIYHLNNDNVVITVTDNDNATQLNMTTIILNSSEYEAGINITLNRTNAITGVFSTSVARDDGPLNITLSSSETNRSYHNMSGNDYYYLNVTAGGWIKAHYLDATDSTWKTVTATVGNDTQTITINATRFIPTTGAESYLITVDDAGNNSNASAADTIEIKVNSTTNSTLTLLSGNETGANTGVYTVTYDVSTSAGDADSIYVDSSNIEQYIYVYYDPTLNGSSGANPEPILEQQVGYYTASTAVFASNDYNVTETATSNGNFTIVDYDANTDNDAVDTVTVMYNSDESTTHTSFTTSETGANTGIFSNLTISFVETPGTGHSINAVNAGQGDTVAMWYEDTQIDGTTTNNITDYAVINIVVNVTGGNSGQGWDLISVPLTLGNTAVSSALQGVTYQTVYWYNDTSDAWEIPTTMEPLKGYAMKVNTSQKAYFAPITSALDVSRTMPTPTARTLSTGWNMIGLNNISSGAAIDSLASLISTTATTTPTWSYLYDWTGLAYTSTVGSTTETKELIKGTGYWIHIREDATSRSLLPSGSGR